MSETSKIQWTDSTGGPWLGCTEVSPGCRHCYARELAENRLAPMIRLAYRSAGFEDWGTRPLWGKAAPRVLTKGFWTDIVAFNKKPWICNVCGQAQAIIGSVAGISHCKKCDEARTFHRRRIFPSLIDWLDDMPAGIIDQDGKQLDGAEVLARFLNAVRESDQVIWILCTKRPEDFFERLRKATRHATTYDLRLANWIENWAKHGSAPKNVILLASVENQAMADERIPELLKIPAACHGLSCEPLLQAVNLCDCKYPDGRFKYTGIHGNDHMVNCRLHALNWVIIGGESGSEARACNVGWIHSLVQQCAGTGAAVFVKQLGALAICDNANLFDFPDNVLLEPYGEGFASCRVLTRDKKGGDLNEFPDQLRRQNWPNLEPYAADDQKPAVAAELFAASAKETDL